jgi:hypothetical protein
MAEHRIKTPSIRDDGLQLEEHRAFQERFWTVERFAWIVFGLLLVAALLGFTGSGGALSRTTAHMEGGSIDHPRVARWESADEMMVSFAAGAAERRLTLSPAFSEALQVEAIQPEPQSSAASGDGAVLTFDTDPEEAAEVTIHFRALKPGLPTFEARIDDGAPVSIGLLVLP